MVKEVKFKVQEVLIGVLVFICIGVVIGWTGHVFNARSAQKESPNNVINFETTVKKSVGRYYIAEKQFKGNTEETIQVLLNEIAQRNDQINAFKSQEKK